MCPFIRLSLVLAVLGLCRCGASDRGPDATDAVDETAVEVSPDVADVPADAPADMPADVLLPDRSEPDAAETAEPDAPAEAVDARPEADVPDPDVPGPTVFAAVPGARCVPASRIGLVQIYGYPAPTTTVEASASINDRVDPWMPGPKLTDASCSFFQEADPAFCAPCPSGQLCAPDATCQALPVPVGDLVLTLSAGGASQAFEADGSSSGAWGTVTLPGRAFAVEVAWSGLTVTLLETAVPEALADATMTLAGAYDAPTALDLTWTPPAAGGSVFTHIPINHHAAGPTFTECTVDASAGALHVDGAMLTPLAVITGLEFQGIEHVRFAAADTPHGCVELRFQVHQYVN